MNRRLCVWECELSRQICCGFAAMDGNDAFRNAFRNDPPALIPSSRPHIDDPIAAGNQLHVMLDDDHGIARIHQLLQLALKPLHVRRMQSRGRLVQHVKALAEFVHCNSVASFTRCASPPDSSVAACPSRR